MIKLIKVDDLKTQYGVQRILFLLIGVLFLISGLDQKNPINLIYLLAISSISFTIMLLSSKDLNRLYKIFMEKLRLNIEH